MGALLALNPAGQTAFMYLFGRVADSAGRKPLILVGMAGSAAFPLVAAAASVPAARSGRLLVAGLAFVLIAAAFSAMTTGTLAFIGDVADELRESAAHQTQSGPVADDGSAAADVTAARESELMGLRSTAKGVGGVVGPVTLGALATWTSYATAIAAGSALAVVATALAAAKLVESRASVARGPVPSDD